MNNSIYGSTSQGAGIYASSTNGVMLSHTTFANNRIVGLQGQGGAFVTSSDANLTIVHVSFINNTIVGDNSKGGAVYMTTTNNITMVLVNFVNNTIIGLNGQGGAFDTSTATNLTVAQSLFVNNSIIGAAGQGQLTLLPILTLHVVYLPNQTRLLRLTTITRAFGLIVNGNYSSSAYLIIYFLIYYVVTLLFGPNLTCLTLPHPFIGSFIISVWFISPSCSVPFISSLCGLSLPSHSVPFTSQAEPCVSIPVPTSACST